MRKNDSLPKASMPETAGFMLDVFLPTIAKGPIIRRPKAVATAERLALEDRAVWRMTKLAEKYTRGPLILRLPFRRQSIILQGDDLHRVLINSPDPFSPASSEKKAALAHFEPKNVLISEGTERTARRALQEQVLDTHSPVHRLADAFIPVVNKEAHTLLAQATAQDPSAPTRLGWDEFIQSWYRAVRRTIFGDNAAEDHELTNMLATLRKNANWSFLRPADTKLRAEFLEKIRTRMQTASPGSLAHALTNIHPQQNAAPEHQIPQWLFAFDPAGMASFRTLALLSTHPKQLETARQELRNDTSGGRYLPYLRACVLESLRLWPTTPMILRQTTREVQWPGGNMPTHCGVLIYAPFFHRNQHVPHPHSFAPERWLNRNDTDDWPLVPFSEGPVICPGRQLVLMLTSSMLAALIRNNDVELESGQPLNPQSDLPGTLNNYSLQFSVKTNTT